MLPLVILVTLGAIEIFVFVQVGEWIGYGWAIVALIAIALFGFWLVKREGLGTWRRAQADAREAYEHWRRCGGAPAFAAYRAAQDRADSAQDELALRSHNPARST